VIFAGAEFASSCYSHCLRLVFGPARLD